MRSVEEVKAFHFAGFALGTKTLGTFAAAAAVVVVVVVVAAASDVP